MDLFDWLPRPEGGETCSEYVERLKEDEQFTKAYPSPTTRETLARQMWTKHKKGGRK